MPEKSSNKASIIVAVITLLFILGGVYLLNMSMNSSNNSTSNSDSSTSSNESSSNKPSTETSATTLSDDLALPTDESTTTTTNSTPSTTSTSNSTTTSPETSTSTKTPTTSTENPQPTTTSSSTTTSAATLSKSEMTAIYKGTEDKTSSWEITGCGLPNAKYCKAGARMSLISAEDYGPLTKDKEYLFKADIEETETQFLINSINSITLKT